MRRAGVLGLAIVLTLGLAVAATQAKPRKVKVDTALTLEDFRGNDWSGEVIADKPKCERKRRVAVTYVGPGGPDLYGETTSADDGAWEVTFEDKLIIGDYEITADKRKIKKRRHGEVKKVIVCKPATLAHEFGP